MPKDIDLKSWYFVGDKRGKKEKKPSYKARKRVKTKHIHTTHQEPVQLVNNWELVG